MDPLDAIMLVMEEAFDPIYGEAWNRRQISDVLIQPTCFYLLADSLGQCHETIASDLAGFALSRQILDEEELLLLAVRPKWRERNIGTMLLTCLMKRAKLRGTKRLFLEMRDGNGAINLYRNCGFEQVGRRRAYYRSAAQGPIDALTFSRAL